MVISITFVAVLFLLYAVWKAESRLVMVAVMVAVLFLANTPGAIKVRDTISDVVTGGDSGVRDVVE